MKLIEKMKSNVGNIDRGLRLGVALLVAVVYFLGIISGTTSIVLGVIAAIFLVTSLVGSCPLYSIFGMSTAPKE